MTRIDAYLMVLRTSVRIPMSTDTGQEHSVPNTHQLRSFHSSFTDPYKTCCWLSPLFKITSTWLPVPFRRRCVFSSPEAPLGGVSSFLTRKTQSNWLSHLYSRWDRRWVFSSHQAPPGWCLLTRMTQSNQVSHLDLRGHARVRH